MVVVLVVARGCRGISSRECAALARRSLVLLGAVHRAPLDAAPPLRAALGQRIDLLQRGALQVVSELERGAAHAQQDEPEEQAAEQPAALAAGRHVHDPGRRRRMCRAAQHELEQHHDRDHDAATIQRSLARAARGSARTAARAPRRVSRVLRRARARAAPLVTARQPVDQRRRAAA